MQITEVGPGIFACLMANETANAGFVITARGVIVVDSLSTPAQGRELAAAIRAQTHQPVLLVVNTHHHFDHVLGNQAFAAPVIAHCALAQQLAQAAARDLGPADVDAWIVEHPEDRWLVDELELIYPNILFEDHLLIDLPPRRLVVQHLGGHTPDSSIVDLTEQGVVFAGDLVFEGRVPFLRHANIRRTIDALRSLERRGARTVVPGHGDLCDTAYVARLRGYLEALVEAVGRLAAKGRTKEEVLDSGQLPPCWTDDRPDLRRANVERVYDELSGAAAAI